MAHATRIFISAVYDSVEGYPENRMQIVIKSTASIDDSMYITCNRMCWVIMECIKN
jgi:hypothetical protein